MIRLTLIIFFVQFSLQLVAQTDSVIHIENKKYFFFDTTTESYKKRDKSGMTLIGNPEYMIDSYVYDSAVNMIVDERRSNKFGYFFYSLTDSASFCELRLKEFNYLSRSYYSNLQSVRTFTQYDKRNTIYYFPNSSIVKYLSLEVKDSYVPKEIRNELLKKNEAERKKHNVPVIKQTYHYWIILTFSSRGVLEKIGHGLSSSLSPDQLLVTL